MRDNSKGHQEKSDGLELGVYLSWIKGELDREDACLELPFSLLLLLSFSGLALLHLSQHSVYTVEQAMKFDIEENANFAWSHGFGHKTVFDVNSIADFWSWFRLGYLPLIVQHSWSYSELLQAGYTEMNSTNAYDSGNLPSTWLEAGYGGGSPKLPVRDDYLHFNRIIGGIRVQQERSELDYDLCQMPRNIPKDIWKPWLGKPCMPTTTVYELAPQPSQAETFENPKRVEWFMTVLDSLDNLRRKAIDMEDGCSLMSAKGPNAECKCKTCIENGQNTPWLDEQAQRVELAFITYNWEYGLLTLVTVNFFFDRGGMIHKFVHAQSSWAYHFRGDPFSWVPLAICDAIWFCSVAYVFTCEVKQIIKIVRASKARWYASIRDDYIEFWNLVDWISILCAMFVCGAFVRLNLESMTVITEMEELMRIVPSDARRQEFQEKVAGFFTTVENLCVVERIFRLSFCFYPMVMMLRLFKSFDAQPRLAIVTRTLVGAGQDMVHFFIVFFSVFLCMAVNSVVLFGQDFEDFATLDRALTSCFRLMVGDWDWDAMREIGLIKAVPWFWIFILVINIVLLNMLLAILMDVYGEVKSNAEDELGLPQQISELIRRRRQFLEGKRVRLTDVWSYFFSKMKDEKDMVASTEVITPGELIQKVSGMKSNQAKRTMKNAREAKERQDFEPYTQDNVVREITDIERRAELLQTEVATLRGRIEASANPDGSLPMMEMNPGHSMRAKGGTGIVDAIYDAVEPLTARIEQHLVEEGQLFEQRQQDLEERQKEMLLCVRDSHKTLRQLHGFTQQVSAALQKNLHDKRKIMPQGAGNMGGISAWADCGAPISAGGLTMPSSRYGLPNSRT